MLTPEQEAERLVDTNYEDVDIREVEKRKDGSYTLTIRDSLVGNFDWSDDVPEPVVGGVLRVYTKLLFGGERYGHAYWVDGEWLPIEYKTVAEREAERKEWLRKYEERRARENRESREKYADLSFLPLPLRRRIERFRREYDEGRGDTYTEPYEMAPVLEAARLLKRVNDPAFGAELKRRGIKAPTEEALALRSYERNEGHGRLDWPDTPEWRLIAFDAINSKMNGYQYKVMEEIMPEMDGGHSGNTWSAAVQFARMILRDGDEAPL
jgi:hypothetical protein